MQQLLVINKEIYIVFALRYTFFLLLFAGHICKCQIMLSFYHITKNILRCLISFPYICVERGKVHFWINSNDEHKLMIPAGLNKYLVDIYVTHVFPSKSSI